jgi:hypothetical protein
MGIEKFPGFCLKTKNQYNGKFKGDTQPNGFDKNNPTGNQCYENGVCSQIASGAGGYYPDKALC